MGTSSFLSILREGDYNKMRGYRKMGMAKGKGQRVASQPLCSCLDRKNEESRRLICASEHGFSHGLGKVSKMRVYHDHTVAVTPWVFAGVSPQQVSFLFSYLKGLSFSFF